MAKKKSAAYYAKLYPNAGGGIYQGADNNALFVSGFDAGGNPTPSATDPYPPEVQAQTFEEPAPVDDGGGGGGTGALAPVGPGALADSPEWLAFLNSMGLEQGQFQADIDRQRGVAQSLAAQQASDIQAAGPLERRNIAGGLETRGMARSGQFIRGLADQRAQEGRRQGQVQSGLAGNLSGLESQLSQKLIDLGARRAQQELTLRTQGYT